MIIAILPYRPWYNYFPYRPWYNYFPIGHVTTIVRIIVLCCRCVHLLAELSQIKTCQSKVVSLLPVLADTTRHKQYSQHLYYFEVLLRQVL